MDDLAAVAEFAEAESLFALIAQAPEPARSALGIASARIGGGVVVSMRHDSTGYWSKALGFGFEEPVSHKLIAEVCDFYRDQASPGAVLQIAPGCLPPEWPGICAAQNISAGSTWVKLVRAASGPGFAPARTDLRVAAVEMDEVAEWASVLLRGFGMPVETMAPVLVHGVASGRFRAYAAWSGDDMVGAANLRIHGDTASFSGASTLPGHRLGGAQSALLAVRARDAAAAGCRWLVAETWKPTPNRQNSSLNNMLRAGFTVIHPRRNWLWKPDGLPA
ncbi:GNAT family N-acetyltransferase [Planotetraspora phitsanulokensis]|uniref:GNAT family acetyltransferase n=1 Tax=Planotetraspora phitsanulokensis TaxID=575192 RepID=A0A8J3XGG5_9ACTN|nr:hypothetical protein [Planotetraspora phitsanulokensis]GII35523.1 GNAT family acetyltransferase [Planotetraspora phitsanulokensis]